jgi:hypothetical protein
MPLLRDEYLAALQEIDLARIMREGWRM